MNEFANSVEFRNFSIRSNSLTRPICIFYVLKGGEKYGSDN